MKNQTKILSILLIVFVCAGLGFVAYKYFSSHPASKTGDWRDFLVYDFKDKTVSEDIAARYAQEFEDLKKKVEENPDDFNSWLRLGSLKKTANDYEGARDIYIYAGQIRPGNSISFANLGDLYGYFLNDPKKAEEALKTAIENDPADYSYRIALADIYRYKFADGGPLFEEAMIKAVADFPDEVNVISWLASYYRQTQQTQKAIEFYEKWIALDPSNDLAKRDLAELKQ